MQKKKQKKRILADELLENQDVAIDIIIHEEVREEVSSSSKKQKACKRIKEPSEKDRKARETEREKLKQLLDARKENLMVYKYFFQQDHQQISRKISESFNFLEKHSNNFLHILCHEVINLVSQKVKSISGNNNQEIFTRKYYQTIKNLMKINEQIS